MKLSNFFESTYRPRRLRGKSAHTLRLYRCSLRKLDLVLGRDARLQDLSDDTVAQVMQSVLDAGGSPFTANKERSQLIAIWRFACQLGLLTQWPTVTAEREPERQYS